MNTQLKIPNTQFSQLPFGQLLPTIIPTRDQQENEEEDCLIETVVSYEQPSDDGDESAFEEDEEEEEDTSQNLWRVCEPKPYQPVGKEHTKQYTFAEHIFNHHQTNKHSSTYTCKFKRPPYSCRAMLKQILESDQWLYKGKHNHPTPQLLNRTKEKKPSFSDLIHSRQEELKEYVISNKRVRNTKAVCYALNKDVNPNDLQQYIFPEQVHEARHKFVHTASISDWNDLYSRKEFTHTSLGQAYLRTLHLYPEFLIQYAADWQIDLLKSVTQEDQLFVDGTFNVCPMNIEQMVTLLVKKKTWNHALPVVHALLQRRQESTYVHMWNHIIRLAPELQNVNNLCISVDFEVAMHNAIKKVIPASKIVGCEFHLKQAILRYTCRKTEFTCLMIQQI